MCRTTRPRVVHCKMDKYDVMADRSTIYGNPFPITETRDRRTAIKMHKDWLNGRGYEHVKWRGLTGPEVMDRVYELRGLVLGCWCAPHACHCDYLLELANKIKEDL